MEQMNINAVWQFVEEAESLISAVQDEVFLSEEDSTEDEIATCISQIEGAVAELNRSMCSMELQRYRTG